MRQSGGLSLAAGSMAATPLFSSIPGRKRKQIWPVPPIIPNVKAFGIFTYYSYQIKADHRMVVRCVLCAGGGEAHDQGD